MQTEHQRTGVGPRAPDRIGPGRWRQRPPRSPRRQAATHPALLCLLALLVGAPRLALARPPTPVRPAAPASPVSPTSPIAPANALTPADPRSRALLSDDPPAAVLSSLGQVVASLREEDPQALASLVDFAGHASEGRFRGTSIQDWEALDEISRLELMQDTLDEWLDDHGSFLRSATLFHFRRVNDPDQGRGPVPDRVIVQAVLKSARRGEWRDLLLFARPDGRVLDLRFSEPYPEGANPAGQDGLLPEPVPADDQLAVDWPAAVDQQERDEALELVADLLDAERKREREEVAEALHRVPLGGVTALIRQLVQMEQQARPDTSQQALLVDTLESITGRKSTFRAKPPFGTDTGAWSGANHAAVVNWVRWHQWHAGNFVTTPVEHPIHPTHSERPARPGPRPSVPGITPTGGLEGGSSRPDPTAPSPGSEPGSIPPAPPGATPPPDRGAPPPPGPGMRPTDSSGSAPALPGTTPEAGSGPPADPPDPTLHLRSPAADGSPPGALPGDDLTLLTIPPEGGGEPSSASLAQVRDRLPGRVLAALESWAPTIQALDLQVALTGHPAFLVLGRASREQLVRTNRVLEQAFDLIDPMLPAGDVEPVVAVLFDPEALRGEFWSRMLDALRERDVIHPEGAADLRHDPRGFTARSQGVFVQPVWDMAGDASAGDDEFRLDNELAHKFTQVLAAQRAGPLPESILWGLGHLVELRLFQSVYQFRKDGFVAVGDHFGWDRSAAGWLERRAKRRSFSLPERVLEASRPSNSLEGPMLAWATLDFLYDLQPENLRALIEDLSELQRSAAPRGGEADYIGDPEQTLAVLRRRLSSVSTTELIGFLGGTP